MMTKFSSTLSARIHEGDLSLLITMTPIERAATVNDLSLHWTAACGGHIRVLNYFHNNGGNLAADNCFALRGAARSGQTDVIDWLHRTIAITPAQRAEALTLACEHGHVDAAKALHFYGAPLYPVQEKSYRYSSPAIRAFLDEQKHTVAADAVATGCAEALRETRAIHQNNANRMKKALRIFGL